MLNNKRKKFKLLRPWSLKSGHPELNIWLLISKEGLVLNLNLNELVSKSFFFSFFLRGVLCSFIYLLKILFCYFYIYLHVYTLFRPPPTSPPPNIPFFTTCGQNLFHTLVVQFCWRKNIWDKKKNIAFC
jgi:hypothetical protein